MTKFILDGLEYSGPYIHAESFSDAALVAEVHGLEVEGELSDIVDLDLECETRVLH